ncbi:MAG: hypothetical protein ATN31_09765 [Candidatus Epulonipiscioides saccharophilum]|nr:MAG: hypothetical protein ATN31_09765 [Epulopiscium sp. AS2M-Bin001]
MQKFKILNSNRFMNVLLRDSLFHTFLVREMTLYSDVKYKIDGTIHEDFYVSKDLPAAPFMSWAFLQPKIISLLVNNQIPSYMKIGFVTSPSKTAEISNEANGFILNVLYEKNEFFLNTAWNPKEFTLDKSIEASWDNKIEQFLSKYTFI